MEVLVSCGCGLDVHQATVVACLLTGEPGALPRKQVKPERMGYQVKLEPKRA